MDRPRTIPFGKASATACALALASCGPTSKTPGRVAAPDPVVARDRVLSDMLLEDRLRGAATPETVAGLYQEMEKARPAGAPPETLEQARPRIVRFLTYDRVKDLVLDLRHRAKIEIVPQSPAPGAAKP